MILTMTSIGFITEFLYGDAYNPMEVSQHRIPDRQRQQESQVQGLDVAV